MSKVILQPSGNKNAWEHYVNTIQNPVPFEKLAGYLPQDDQRQVLQMYDLNSFIPTWGVTPGTSGANVRKWDRISSGDVAFFAANKAIFASGVVTYKFHNKELAAELWGYNLDGHTWEYIYFLDELKTQSISYADFNKIAGYSENFVIQGFSVLDEARSSNILTYFDLHSDVYLPDVSEEEYGDIVGHLEGVDHLDTVGITKVRKEQAFLRKWLFANRNQAHCGICNKKYPVSMLVAAHIKKRSVCTVDEKLDYRNVVIPICKLGCDELFERGYITVRNGIISKGRTYVSTEALDAYLSGIIDKQCSHWNAQTESYFQWHDDYHNASS